MAKVLVDIEVAKIREKLGGKTVEPIICLSHKDNWRKKVFAEYKAHRKDNRKPLCYQDLRAYVSSTYSVECWQGLEADDVMGLMATAPKANAVIVSIDKDLKTVPGAKFNPETEESFHVSEEQADYAHMMQTLCGDATDGYPGCPGVGPKRAEAILAESSDPCARWISIVAAFEKAGQDPASALVQARVSRILRHGEYDKINKEVKLWNPPTAS